MDNRERRRVERLKLSEPLPALFEKSPSSVVEIGLLGAMVEHSVPLDKGSTGNLEFVWDEEDISLVVRIARSEVSVARSEARGECTYVTGVEIVSASEEDSKVLKRMISVHVVRSLERMKANARGNRAPAERAMALLETSAPFLASADAADLTKIYITCRLDASGNWHRAEVLKPKQPPDGFTVAAACGEDEIAMLCTSYEQGDEEARKMIRVCAEMTVASGEDVPPPSFA